MILSVVTGGAGFLGSHLCDRLLAEGETVIAVDDLSTGSLANIQHLRAHPRFVLVRRDLSLNVVGGFGSGADYIYNLACPASPVDYQADPIKTTRTCFFGALHVLDLAQASGARVLQASTSEVYGDPLVHPQAERYWGNTNPVGIRSCYDEGKRIAETLFADYRRHRGVDARIVRIFNTYGDRMRADDGRVVSNFVVQALRGHDLTIYGDGSQTRSFCFVDDLVDGLVRMMRAPEASGPTNLGNPTEFTIGELAERVIALTGTRSRIVFRPLPGDDPRQRRPDITIATTELGWVPRVALDDGLARTVAYFRETLSAAHAA